MNELFMVYFDTETRSTELINGDRLRNLWAEPSGFFWIDINNPDVSVLNELLGCMEITCVWTDHFESPEILPHMHDTPAAVSFYLFDIEHVESLGDTSKDIQNLIHCPVLVILGKRFIITYHQKQVDLIDYIKKDYEANFKLAGKTPGFIAFLLFQHSLYNYARLNLMNDNFLDELEFGLITGDISKNVQRISTAGYNILTLKKLNANLHIILLMLVSKQSYTVSEPARLSFTEILKETISIRESIDSSRYLLDSIIAAMDAEASQKTSEIIRVLTITSCIFMPLTLITGIYGMNFHTMPGLDWNYGFTAAITGMIGVALGFVYILKKLGWLSANNNGQTKEN
jgi:magnesium transporter